MINYQLGLLIAMAAYVYTNILTDVNQIFNGIYNWLDEKLNSSLEGGDKHWLFMVLIYCEKCVGGQMALWIYLYFNYKSYSTDTIITLLQHVFFVTFTILSATVIKELHKHIKPNE